MGKWAGGSPPSVAVPFADVNAAGPDWRAGTMAVQAGFGARYWPRKRRTVITQAAKITT